MAKNNEAQKDLYQGNHGCQLYMAEEDIYHSRTRAQSLQARGACEWFHRTLQVECYGLLFRKKLYRSLEKLQVDLEKNLSRGSEQPDNTNFQYSAKGQQGEYVQIQNPLIRGGLETRGIDTMAERAGFEPAIPLRIYRFSRPAPSTTRPPLREFRTVGI